MTLPAQLWTDLGLPGSVSTGQEIAGVSIVGRRSLVLLVPDADTATSGCAYSIGAENVPTNTAPEVTSTRFSSATGQTRAGAPVTFSADATDADGDPLEYTWDFGDGSTASGAVVKHTYSRAGTYTAVVTVTDGVDSALGSVTVTLKGKSGR